MQIVSSGLFRQFPEIIFGFSTKVGLNRPAPFYFNLSLTVGDNEKIVWENREAFLNELGLKLEQVAIQKQIHSDIITVVSNGGIIGESDAMITSKSGIGLAVSSADCVPVFIYDKKNRIVAGIHSGWRGTQKQIVKKSLQKMQMVFNSQPENLFVFIGPSIIQKNYEVGKEVAEQFDEKYIEQKNDKLYLDVIGVNLDYLFEFGIPLNQIEVSPLCSYEENDLLHSFRRDGVNSGRSLGVIALRDKI